MFEPGILRDLTFPEMTYREEGIDPAYSKTFQWILSEPSSDSRDRSRDHLLPWLQSERTTDNGIFWIRGKAGSGKSTLMKYLRSDPRLASEANKWSPTGDLLIVSFFIVEMNASYLQQSLEGLLRALLYQVLGQSSYAIPKVLPSRWERTMKCVIGPAPPPGAWTLSELSTALLGTFKELPQMKHILILIDGLDEFIPSPLSREELQHDESLIRHKSKGYIELGRLCQKLSAFRNVKLLVSSRPLSQFFDSFESGPQLKLEDATARDIDEYIDGKLQESKRWKNLTLVEPIRAPNLISRIREKAVGVFLWVRIVVETVVQSLVDGDNIRELEVQLNSLPEELGGPEGLYWSMLKNIHPDHVSQGLFLFSLVMNTRTPLHPLDLYFAEKIENDSSTIFTAERMTADQIRANSNIVQDRLRSRCAGLLEVYGQEDDLETHTVERLRVRLLHLSVQEFLHLPDVFQRLSSRASDQNPLPSLQRKHVSFPLLGSVVIHLKVFGIRSGERHQNLQNHFSRAPWDAAIMDCFSYAEEIETSDVSPKYAAVLDELDETMRFGLYSLCYSEYNHLDFDPLNDSNDGEHQDEWARKQFLMDSDNPRLVCNQLFNTGQPNYWMFDTLASWVSIEGPGSATSPDTLGLNDNMLTLAIRYGLYSYIQSKDKEVRREVLDRQGWPILAFALMLHDWGLGSFFLLPTDNRSQRPNPKIVKLLLESGANPVAKIDGSLVGERVDTAWNFALEAGIEECWEYPSNYDRDGEAGRRLWSNIIISFLQHGALKLAEEGGSDTISAERTITDVSLPVH
jgi:hypothetical protein